MSKCFFFQFLCFMNTVLQYYFCNIVNMVVIWLKAKLTIGDRFTSDVLLTQCYLVSMQKIIVQCCDFILIIAFFLLYSHLFVQFCKHFSSPLRNMSSACYGQWVAIALCPGTWGHLVGWSL